MPGVMTAVKPKLLSSVDAYGLLNYFVKVLFKLLTKSSVYYIF